MKHNKKRIEKRIVHILSALSILGIVLSFIGFRVSIREVELEDLQENLKMSAKHKLVDMNQFINGMVADLEQTARAINEYDDFWHPDVQKILKLSNDMNWFDYTGVVDAEGNGYDSSGNIVSNGDREYFQTAMQGQVAFSEVISSKIFEGERVQIIAHPLRTEDNKIRGVVFGVLNIEDLGKIISHQGKKRDSNLYIIDSCGAYIGEFQENQSIASNMNFWDDLEQMGLDKQAVSKIKSDFEERKEGEFSYTYQSNRYYACYVPIGPNKWQLIYSVSDSSADEIVQSIYALDTQNTLFAVSCYLVLTICIMWYFKQSNDRIKKAHQESKKNMEYMHIAMEHSNNTVFDYDQKNRVVRLKTDTRNQLFCCSIMTYVPASFISLNVIAPDSICAFKRLFERIKTEQSCEEDIQILSDDEEIWYRISMNNIYDERASIIGTVGIVEDISGQKRKEAETRRKLQIQDTIIANALEYGKVDLQTGTLLEFNGEELRMPFQDFLHKNVQEKVSQEHTAYVEKNLSLESICKAYQQGREMIEMQFLMKCDGAYRWVSCVVYKIHTGAENTVIFVVTDIDDRKRKEIALKQQAERDGLTGLYNAVTARAKINELLSQKDSLNENHVFVLLDLDNYKQINDTFGHSYGDQVLVDIATTLNTRFRSSDIVGRLGGDEFIILLRSVRSYDYAEHMIEELCKVIHKTYTEGDKAVTISASIGIAIAPNDGSTFEELYRKSDMAQYQIKNHGKNGFKRFQ